MAPNSPTNDSDTQIAPPEEPRIAPRRASDITVEMPREEGFGDDSDLVIIGHGEPPSDIVPPPPILTDQQEENDDTPIKLRSKPEESEMDMTPMVDVTFQLLIFFMITASFSVQKSLRVPKPQEQREGVGQKSLEDFQQDAEFVTLRIDANDTYHLASSHWDDELEIPSEHELIVKLREARRPNSQGNVASRMVVVANGECTHQRVVTAIDSGIAVGMDDIQFVSIDVDE